MTRWLKDNFSTWFIVLQVWVDGLVILGACLGSFLFYKTQILTESTSRVHWYQYSQLFIVITGVTLVCFWGFGLYRWRKSILNVEEYRSILQAVLVSFLGSSTSIFLLRGVEDPSSIPTGPLYQVLKPIHDMVALATSMEHYSWVLFVFFFLAIFLAVSFERAILFRILSGLFARGWGNVRVAIYGSGPMALHLEQKLRLFPTLGFKFMGFLVGGVDGKPVSLRGHPILGGRGMIAKLAKKQGIRRVFVADPDMEEEELVGLCQELEAAGVEYQVVPRLFHFFNRRFRVDSLDSIPLISQVVEKGKPLFAASKRFLDLLVSSLFILVGFPVFLVVALLLKRESPGPVFFRQERIGQNGKPFMILKFRTMYQEMCEDALSPISSKDPRITRLGRFLRRLSLDEFPQFLNVLRGEMSLVGPRPEMPFIVEKYSAVDRLRLDARPGITGLWQVSEARKDPIHENLDYDLYYIENQSFFLDMVILFLTLMAVLKIRTVH